MAGADIGIDLGTANVLVYVMERELFYKNHQY